MTDTPSPRTDRAEPDEPRSSCSREPKGQAKAKRTCIYSWRKAAKSALCDFMRSAANGGFHKRRFVKRM